MDLGTPFDYNASTCSREACDVRFAYLSKEEIQGLSAKHITASDVFSTLGNAIDNGLHSPFLGPLDSRENPNPSCLTCGLQKDCPGHMGHIELACTVYNPFLFDNMVKLLGKMCLGCHKLKATESCSEKVVTMLDQLQDGEIAKVPPKLVQSRDGKSTALCMENKPADEHEELLRWEHHLPDGTVATTTEVLRKRGAKEMTASADEVATLCGNATLEADADRDRKRARALEAREAELATLAESSSLEAYRAVINDYFGNISTKCPRCSAHATKWRKVGYTKVFCKQHSDDLFCMPSYLRDVLGKLWENENRILCHLLPALRGVGPAIFFLDAVLVPPNRFRPPGVAVKGSQRTLHVQTAAMREIMECNDGMRSALDQHHEQEVCKAEGTVWEAPKKSYGAKPILNPFEACGTLQDAVNIFLDSAKGERQQKLLQNGIRQLLEKKAGLFRMKMMGKRVNFAARSVISPDPNLETTEIGIPTFIAAELSYPEVGTEYNVEELRKLIVRGKNYPGAKEVHELRSNGSKKVYRLGFMSEELRESLSKKLITDLEKGTAPMTVFRHLRNGDPLLVNRQPTLHKPGIMAHVVKVLKKEKTIRMHYANCNTYNADFDGDEMNLHAPQDPIGRMEALGIAKADRQYLVPTSGKPLRGLIQDSVIAGVMLTKRDTFFDRADVCLLLYGGLRAVIENGDLPTDWTPNTDGDPRPWMTPDLMAHVQKHKLKLDEPCVFKPKMMWSGKQVLSMLIKNILLIDKAMNPRGGADDEAAVAGGGARAGKQGDVGKGIFLNGKSKTPGDIWKGKMDGSKEESTVNFHDTDLLQGVLDKNQFGATSFSIIHTLFEVSGGHVVGMVLASFCRIFLLYLQLRGFTCAFHDLLLKDETERQRDALIVKSREVSTTCVEEWLGKHDVSANQAGDKATLAELSQAARGLMESNAASAQALEGAQLGKMQQSWTNTIDVCVPAGQLIPFPRNCFASMVQTGAKGSKVNHSQVSCLLGQQELEGRQVPLMPTGRSLPSFAPFDMAIRTRGFITDRFLTGIRPQEFFFHCMAGREGLVDTAVKTSRSGYLQRCLVKHLEGIKVDYDLTVRDADGTVVQFLYGEDGVDVTRSAHLLKFQELRENFGALGPGAARDLGKLRAAGSAVDLEAALELSAARRLVAGGDRKKAAKKVGQIAEMPNMPDSMRAMLRNAKEQIALAHPKCPANEVLDPIASLLSPGHFLGSTSEKHQLELESFLGKDESEEAKQFANFARLHFMRSLVEPGEAVGVVAAQSMGEPSTQMTLNTFHLAGHGGANVTLGIPRLREIVQTASPKPSTPLMQIKILQDVAGDTSVAARRHFGQQFIRQFRRVALQDILARVAVQERVTLAGGQVVTAFHCHLEFWPIEELMSAIPYINREVLEGFMTKIFHRKLTQQVKTLIIRSKLKITPSASKVTRQKEEGDDVGMGEDADEAHKAPAEKKSKPKKRMRIGGRTADDDEADEAEEAAADAADDKDDDADEESEDSGMYDEDDADGKEAKGINADDEKDADENDEKDAGEDFETAIEREVEKHMEAEEGVQVKTELGVRVKQEPGKAAAALKETLEQANEREFDAAQDSGLLVQPGKLNKNSMTFVVTIKSSDCAQKLLISEVLKDLLKTMMIQDPVAEGIMKVHLQNENNKGEIWLECEGVNLTALFTQPRGCLDLEHIKSNDIAAIFKTYGVEAGRANIVKQIADVFGHYGIEVNHRHLSLIADHMSQAGGYRAFNRKAMENCSSPLLAMSYETTMQFMNQACQTAHSDNMRSPTASIVLGLPPAVGTGMVSLLVDLKFGMKESARRKFVF